MKKFKFSLEQVLKVRKIKEKEKQRELAEILQQLDHEKQQLNRLHTQSVHSWNVVNTMKTRKTNPSIISLAYNSLEGQRVMHELQLEKISKLMIKVNIKRNELIKAQSNRKILDKLKESQFSEYVEENERQEQKFIDEIAIIKSGRKIENLVE